MSAYLARRLHLTARLAQLERHLREIETDRRRVTNPLDPDWEDQAPTRENDAVLDKRAAGDQPTDNRHPRSAHGRDQDLSTWRKDPLPATLQPCCATQCPGATQTEQRAQHAHTQHRTWH
jgi:hypothetical protein